MPQIKPISITAGESPLVYQVTGNTNGIAAFATEGSTLRDNKTLVVQKRAVTSAQTTRKTVLRSTMPVVSPCTEGECPQIIGSTLAVVELTSAVDSTIADRTLAYDALVAQLSDADIRNAFIKNESFW